MCKRDGETIDYVVLYSRVARELWNMVSSLFGVHWVMPKGVVELLMSLKGKFTRCPNVVIWSMIPHYLMWGLLGEECLDF